MIVEKQKPSEFLSFPNKNTLSNYVDLLIKANKNLNLISKSTENDIWERHILDSAQLINLFPSETKTVCDVGSGAGLPGVVLKIIRTSLNVTIVEPSKRKSDFIKYVSNELSLNLNVIQKKLLLITLKFLNILLRILVNFQYRITATAWRPSQPGSV